MTSLTRTRVNPDAAQSAMHSATVTCPVQVAVLLPRPSLIWFAGGASPGEVAVWVPFDAGVVGGGAAVSPAGVVTGGTPEHDEVVGDQVLVQRQQMGEAGEPGRSLYFVCCHPEAGVGVEVGGGRKRVAVVVGYPVEDGTHGGDDYGDRDQCRDDDDRTVLVFMVTYG